MNIFQKNLSAIEEREPALVQLLKQAPGDPAIRLVRNGLEPVYIERILEDRSTVQFKRERMPSNIRRITERKIFSFSEVIVLIGIGLGETLHETLKSSDPTAFILLIEPSLPFFRKLIEAFDISKVLADPRVSLSVGEDTVTAVMTRFESKFGIFTRPNFQVIKNGLSVSCDTEYCKQLDATLHKQKTMAEANLLSITRLSDIWQKNIFTNLPHILGNPGIIHLFGKMKDIPAVIVAAGPSLDKTCRWLKKLGDSMVIICVDTALKTVLRNGVRPHFVISLDALFENYTHIDGARESDYTLIVNPVTHPLILAENKGEMMVTSYVEPLVKWIERYTGELGMNITGGSVATSAFDLAYRMGCSPIVLTGQDLAFTGGRTHSGGGSKEEILYATPNSSVTSGERHNEAVRMELPHDVVGNLGHMLKSSGKMNLWKNWFEIQIARNAIECINATEGGAEIKGARKACMQEIVAKYGGSRHGINGIIKSSRPVKIPVDLSTIKKRLNEISARARDIKKACSMGIKEAENIQAKARDKAKMESASSSAAICSGLIHSIMKEEEFLSINHWRLERTMDKIQRIQSGIKPSDEQKKMFLSAEAYLLFFRDVYRVTKEFEKNVRTIKHKDVHPHATRAANVQ